MGLGIQPKAGKVIMYRIFLTRADVGVGVEAGSPFTSHSLHPHVTSSPRSSPTSYTHHRSIIR